MYVVIMGCGRVGSSLAGSLSRLGHDVAVIDREPGAFRRLDADFAGTTVVGMGFDRDVLTRAGIERADAFAAVSSGDNSNIIAARVARETFGVDKVVARIYDAKRAAVYERLGIPTVATVPWSTDRFLHTLTQDGELAKWRDPSGTVAVTELPLHEDWAGRPVTELEAATGSRVAFLIRFGTGVLPTAKTVVQADDQVYVAAVSGTVAEAVALAGHPPPDRER
ncbi:TrkA family potassium uptake protein [Rhodococcus triatomae]|uniref:Trk system potassium uptake protein TrkA n=1 Tax=Rhodococcus triatomae TaxID=300028 RepID=A0A1G8MNX7_9NOCA|nr:TrkA family potassium uptake protein [Rhodococcus triatomae]QNG19045.1 TrkA family potassium uptake protein [Rhodococcus triatomae]QNG25042.1 TrkA family potassium uptake protein [Rhodococcus triatomae]SDI69515.1 trk system potassium uptake protein TrkA [Rhodococcus triatomae]